MSLDDVKTAIAEIGPRVGFSDFSARMGQAERPIHHTRLQGSFGDGAPMAVKLDVDPHAWVRTIAGQDCRIMTAGRS